MGRNQITESADTVWDNNDQRVIILEHYENMPMQYIAIFHGCKIDNFQMIKLIFLVKNMKIMHTHVKSSFTL